jgi:hypothetical protein
MQKLQQTVDALSLCLYRLGGGTGTPGGNYGLHGSLSDFTEYGTRVDPPGSKYYDSDSYHGIGHIDGVRYNLKSEPSGVPTAMHDAYARGHHHIKPGDYYISDKDHNRHRWLDTTGSQSPTNEDVYKGASVTNNYPIYALDSTGVDAVLREQGKKIYQNSIYHRRNDLSRSAVV